ncbi:MAG: HAMP domain-containing histidine kinase [Flammeovirgaceae bacterium]|nr:HAMP domain-containing histidine kinase [Flammeovirgaceae bacterium]
MTHFWHILSNWGVKPSNSEGKNKSIYLANQLSILLIIPFLFFLASTIVFSLPQHFIHFSFCIFIFLLVPLLNRWGFTGVSRTILCVGPTLVITLASIYSKLDMTEANLMVALAPRAFILCMAVLPHVLFNYEDSELMWFSFIFSSLCVLFYDEIHLLFGIDISHLPYVVWKYDILRSTISITFITITMFLYLLQGINEKFQKRIETQKKELVELNSIKDKLLGIISHDLRSPLNSLQGVLELLQLNGLSSDQIRTISMDLNGKLKNTIDVMDNLLHWTKTQMNGIKVNKQEVNLNKTVQKIIDLLIPQAEKKKITIHNLTTSSSNLWADKEMTIIIIRNLISNAIKFTKENGNIYIKSTESNNNGHTNIVVEDDGVGMSQEEITKLFSPQKHFSKAGTANEKGSGLGLILCKEFVEKNGGKIWVESFPRRGSRFTFSLQKYSNKKESKVLTEIF